MRKLLVFAAFTTFAVGVAACTGADDDDDDGSPTPTASPTGSPGALDLMVSGSAFDPHEGEVAGLRVLDGTSVVFCTLTTVMSGSFNVGTSGILTAGTSYDLELWAGLDGNDTYDPAADAEWMVPLGTVSTDVSLDLNYNDAVEQPITWSSGTGCPGD